MRSAVCIVSALLVAGGLSWAVGMAAEPGAPRSAAPRSGSTFFFSRSGKNTARPAQPDAAQKEAADRALARQLQQDALDDAAPQPYVRSAGAAGSDRPAVKNYYNELFRERDLAAQAAARPAEGAIQQTAHEQGAENFDALTAEELAGKVIPANYAEQAEADDHPHIQQIDHRPAAVGTAKAFRKQRADVEPVISTGESADFPEVSDTAAAVEPPVPTTPAAPVANHPVRPIPAAARAPEAAAPVAQPVRQAVATRPAGVSAKTVVPATAEQAPKSVTARKPEPAATAPAVPVAAVPSSRSTGEGLESASNDGLAPAMSLKWVARGEVSVGQECKCALVVKNTGAAVAKEVVVDAFFPRTVRLLNADPFPSETRDHLTWNFAAFAPGEEKTIEITLMAAKRGDLATQATVRFSGTASTVFKIEEPQLAIAIAGPNEARLGESATQVVSVSNPGTGTVRDVVVQASLPDGLSHPRGKQVQIEIGSLSPGETREIRLALAAINGGNQPIVVEARGSGNLVQQAKSQIHVAAPQLEVAVSGPSLRYVDRNAQLTINVSNTGAAATSNVRVLHQVPKGFEFVKADRGGKLDAAQSQIQWFVGRIEAGQSVQLQVELASKQIGNHKHVVQAISELGTVAEANLETRVEGTAALVMEVVDRDDPVEIASQTEYEIRVRNDGSKGARNVAIACELPQGVELIGADGPTAYLTDKGVVHFKPLADLAPRKMVTFRVKVQGTIPGNLRFKARLTSDSTPEPMFVEELTKFYAD